MTKDDILAFAERDRERLRARRLGGSSSISGNEAGARPTAAFQDDDTYSYSLPRSTISTAGEGGEDHLPHVRVTYGTEFRNGHFANGSEDRKDAANRNNNHDGDDKDDDDSDDGEEPIQLTQSTHSFIFTEPICSLPFLFALIIAAMSYCCLILALLNNLSYGEPGNLMNVPVQVTRPVRGAQYLSLVIGLLMEEEIPTGIYMLRMIPRQTLQSKFPNMRFWRFTFSSLIRICMGYIFLLNMFLVVVQATGVIDIFYDVLALQFVQQLDDICFGLARMDVFGKRMKTATTQKCFRVEFERFPFSASRWKGVFLKVLYFINIAALLTGMFIINSNQNNGKYYCDSIMVTFGDEIWENAIVLTTEGKVEESVLVFSYFNGVYKKSDEMYNRRPVYVEQNKFDSTPYMKTIPAQIKYCESEQAWVFMHPHIRKSRGNAEGDCPWILSSEETSEFNLLEVPPSWRIWTGTINPDARLSTLCNKCNNLADCNYHGSCVNGECQCDKQKGYFGTHCEHETPCPVLMGDWNDTWHVTFIDDVNVFVAYDRPVYRYHQGLGFKVNEDNLLTLLYAGSRWFGMVFQDGKLVSASDETYWVKYAHEFHAFWEKAYSDLTKIVSDTTTESDPVSVDFYMIGERGKQYGPYGELWPMSEPRGSGFYRCVEDSNIVTEIFNDVYGSGRNHSTRVRDHANGTTT